MALHSIKSPLIASTRASINEIHDQDNPAMQSKLTKIQLVKLKYDIQCLKFFSCFSFLFALGISLLSIFSVVYYSSFQSVFLRLNQLQIWESNVTDSGFGYRISMHVYNPNNYYFPMLKQGLFIKEVEFDVSTFYAWETNNEIIFDGFFEGNSNRIILGGCNMDYEESIEIEEITKGEEGNKRKPSSQEPIEKIHYKQNVNQELNLSEENLQAHEKREQKYITDSNIGSFENNLIEQIFQNSWRYLSSKIFQDSQQQLTHSFGCFIVSRHISREELQKHEQYETLLDILTSPQTHIGFKISGRAKVKFGFKVMEFPLEKTQIHFTSRNTTQDC